MRPSIQATEFSARRIASGVAGADSTGSSLSPPAAATASRMAKNTLKGSSSGGSPTALLRWMLSSTLPLSNSLVLKMRGASLAVGIL